MEVAKEVFKLKYNVLTFRNNLISEENKLKDEMLSLPEINQLILSNKIKKIYVVIE